MFATGRCTSGVWITTITVHLWFRGSQVSNTQTELSPWDVFVYIIHNKLTARTCLIEKSADSYSGHTFPRSSMAPSKHTASISSSQECRFVLGRRCTVVTERPTHIGPWPVKLRSDSDPIGDRQTKPKSRPPIEKRHSVAEVLKSVDEQCRYIEALMRWDDEQVEMRRRCDLQDRGCVSAPVTPGGQGEPFWGGQKEVVFYEKSFQVEKGK